MTNALDETLKKSIKKNLYAKAQTAQIIFPPGLSAIALAEAKAILSDLWCAQKFTGEIQLLKNVILVRPVYLHAIIELVLRSHCFSDVRLLIFKDRVVGKKAFEKACREIPWDHYLNTNMGIKIKVNSIASKAFHETGLKHLLAAIIKPYVQDIVHGEKSHETTCLYVEFYKDKLSISVSLAGQPLYKRGHRGQLSASAPLREDIAACCIQNMLLFAKKQHLDFAPHTVLVPFSGTGTFVFEYLQIYLQFSPALLLRDYAFEKMPFFKKSHFSLLVQQAKERCLLFQSHQDTKNIKLFCLDTSEKANAALENNLSCFKDTASKIGLHLPEIIHRQADFFDSDVTEFSGDILMMLNPPYGVRLNKKHDAIVIYKKIAKKINEIAKAIKSGHVLGFVLCPTEETWSALMSNLTSTQVETYHMTQGGLDIRVCQFCLPPS